MTEHTRGQEEEHTVNAASTICEGFLAFHRTSATKFSEDERMIALNKAIDITQTTLTAELSRTRRETIAEVERFAQKQVAIHKQIIDDHDILPSDWHEGQIKAYTELLTKLKDYGML